MTQRVAARSGGGGGVVSPPVPVMSKDLAYVVGTLVEPDGFAARRITLDVTQPAMALLAHQGFDPAFGARPLKRTIQREISDPMAVRILQGSLSDGDTVTVDVVDNRIALR